MRQGRRYLTLLLIALTGYCLPAAAERQLQIAPTALAPGGERRIALAIGNSAYKNAPLRNPVNDVRALGKVFAATGFAVTVVEDGTQTGMRRAIRDFGNELLRGGVGLFYFAGHGMQVRGRNYLVPVNADIEAEDEVEDQAVDANFVLSKMDSARNVLNLMILDACRNNPFARSFRSSTQGLAQMDAPSGTLIAFATAPGSVASDGDGRNSVYTKHLLANLMKPGLPIEQLFKEVRIGVARDTGDRQVPWESSSLKGNFFFVAAAPAAFSAEDQRRQIDLTINERLAAERAEQQRQMERMIQDLLARQRALLEEEARKRGEAPARPAGPAAAVPDRELAFWESIKSSSNPEDHKAYLAQYPQGTFAALARSRASAQAQAPIAAKPREPPKTAAAPAQVASIAPAALIGMGIDDPRFPRIGDSWEYQYVDTTSKRRRSARFQVTGVSKDGILESGGFSGSQPAVRAYSSGAHLVHNEFWEFSPYLLSFGSPGSSTRWDAISFENFQLCHQPGRSCRFDGRVAGREKVATPAGTFDALKIVIDFNGRGMTSSVFAGATTWREMTYWYSEEVKRVVKASARERSGSSEMVDYDFELMSYRLN